MTISHDGHRRSSSQNYRAPGERSRHARPAGWREERAPTSWTVSAGQSLESREFWEILDRCLSQLPPQMSIVFTLREIDGLAATEICEILNITPNNLWVLLHRSRSKLRQLLEVNWFPAALQPREIRV